MGAYERVTKTVTQLNDETDPVLHRGFTTLTISDEVEEDFIGTVHLLASYDGGSTWLAIWEHVVAAGDVPVYKSIWTAEEGVYFKLKCVAFTSATGATLALASRYAPAGM